MALVIGALLAAGLAGAVAGDGPSAWGGLLPGRRLGGGDEGALAGQSGADSEVGGILEQLSGGGDENASAGQSGADGEAGSVFEQRFGLEWSGPAERSSESVNVVNFRRADSDYYMGSFVQKGSLGTFIHQPSATVVDPSPDSAPQHGQTVIRSNRDTLYSAMVLDLTTDAVLVFPDPGERFVSLGSLSETSDVWPASYAAGRYRMSNNCNCKPPCRRTLASGEVCTGFPTRYACILVRTLVDPDNFTDAREAWRLQRSWRVEQESRGAWAVPDWNQQQLRTMRSLLLLLARNSTAPVTFGFFTGPEKIDHLYGLLSATAGWGGARSEDQTYTGWSAPDDHETWTLTMPPVPLVGNGFWSVTVYNKEGFMFALPANYNSAVQGAAGLNTDGTTTIFFGGCDDLDRQAPSAAHCLPIQPGWNMLIRFFRPSSAILNGAWAAPVPVPTMV